MLSFDNLILYTAGFQFMVLALCPCSGQKGANKESSLSIMILYKIGGIPELF